MDSDQRRYPRYKTLRIPVATGGSVRSGAEPHLVDISRCGAFLRDCRLPSKEAVVSINAHRRPVLERRSVVRREGGAGDEWCAVDFIEPLSDFEIAPMVDEEVPVQTAGTRGAFALAWADRDQVQREIGEIKACRSQMFVWTVGAVATATLAIWTSFLNEKLTMAGVLASMTIVLGALCVGMLAIAEKLRAIRLREGFVQALDSYLAQGLGPRDYPGWTALRTHFNECGAIRRLGKCSRHVPIERGLSCRDEGEMKASLLNSAKHLYPSTMSSFMSLSATILGLAYVGVVSLFAFALASWWHARPALDLTLQSVLVPFTLGFFMSTPMVRFRALVIGMIVGFAGSLILGAIFPAAIWVQTSCFALGTVLGAFAWFFIRELRDIRVGRFSSDTLACAWAVVLTYCRPRTQAENGVSFYKSRKWYVRLLKTCFTWLIHREDHERTYRRCTALARAPYDTRPN
jgi:hypothetical protein